MGSDAVNTDRENTIKFQSTLPHGERLSDLIDNSVNSEFQSTLPHGERHLIPINLCFTEGVSIHAPTWGATQLDYIDNFVKQFQSTLPHGERLPPAVDNI